MNGFKDTKFSTEKDYLTLSKRTECMDLFTQGPDFS